MEMVERVRENGNARGSGRMKTFLGLVALTFAVALALVIGNRLSDQALAVLAGAVCGVGAAIPTSLIIVAVSRRQREEPREVQPMVQQGAYPPVVVIAPQGHQQQPYGWNGLPASLSAPSQREFTVVGGPPTHTEVRANGNYF
jgi:hypothetical protein